MTVLSENSRIITQPKTSPVYLDSNLTRYEPPKKSDVIEIVYPGGSPFFDERTGRPRCPDPNTLILLSDGTEKRAGDLKVGDEVKTQHETTFEWGNYKVSYVEVTQSQKVKIIFNNGEISCSISHKFCDINDNWVEAQNLKIGDQIKSADKFGPYEVNEIILLGYGDVVVINVEQAHTYISNGILSHNKTIALPIEPSNPSPPPSPQPGDGGGGFPPGGGEIIPIPPNQPPSLPPPSGFQPSAPSLPNGYWVPGTPSNLTITQTGTATRIGTSTRINTSFDNKSLGNKLLSLDVVPYMRSRNIEFIAKKLKPNTTVYPFFDGQSVFGYIIPKILEIEMISGSFIEGETIVGSALVQNSNIAVETSIEFRLAKYNHKYGTFNDPSEIYSSNPYNRNIELQPYSETSTTLNIDTTSLSDFSVGNYGGNIFTGMILIGNRSGSVAKIINKRLVTDSIGTVIGSLFIPDPNISGNPKFSTGNKVFRLTDNPSSSDISGTFLTYANAYFSSQGLITQSQESILSIRNIEKQVNYLTETKTITNTTITSVPGQPIFVPTPTPTPTPTPGGGSPTPTPGGTGGTGGGGTGGGGGGGGVPTPPTTQNVSGTVISFGSQPGKSPTSVVYVDRDGDGAYDTRLEYASGGTANAAQSLLQTGNVGTRFAPGVNTLSKQITPEQLSSIWGTQGTTFNSSNQDLLIGYTCRTSDPLAQTFKIGSEENQVGRYITSIDLFFYNKSKDLPVYVEIRPVELGLPTTKIYPFSRVEILPNQINVSENGTVSTRVNFHAPVFLEGNKEHAIVLLSDSTDYSVFISRLGETDITTINLPESERKLVTTQPILGSLFKSQNASTWTPSQYEDLKFNLYCAVFEPSGSVNFFNPELNRSNDQIAVLQNDALQIRSKKIRVGIGTTLSVSTIADLTGGSSIIQNDTDAIGDFAYVTGIASGPLSISNSGIGYTPSVGIQTYNSVPLISISGFGRDATANITVIDGSITYAEISNGGTGYQIGDILTCDTIGTVSIGRNLRLSVQNLQAFNELVIDNVQGEFEVGVAKTIRYYSSIAGIGYTDLNGGDVYGESIISERDGLHILVNHRNHGMNSKTNLVNISNVISDITPVRLNQDIESDYTGNIIINGSIDEFSTFENVGISSTNPGYIIINSEIISYTGLNNNSFTGITRGIDSTPQTKHLQNTSVYKYELGGVSLRRINKTHTLQDSDFDVSLDSYFIKINTSENGVDRSNGIDFPKLYLNQTKSTGGNSIFATQNIQYDIAHPIVQTFTPPQTTVTASIRTISGSSINGLEVPFLDRGTQSLKLNEDNYFENPRLICSRINEKFYLNNIIQGNKSLQMTLNLSTVNRYLSPMIDLDRVGLILTSNKVNSPILDYVSDFRVTTLEDDPNAFVYATKPIELEVPATSIKIIVSAHINIYNDIRALFAIMKDINEDPVYYPFPGNGNFTSNGRTINYSANNGRPDLPFKVTSNLGFTSEEISFTDYEFTINDLESFRYFSIKLVGSSTSQTYPPRIRDLRVIALA